MRLPKGLQELFYQAGTECPHYLPARRRKGSSKDGVSLLGGDEHFSSSANHVLNVLGYLRA